MAGLRLMYAWGPVGGGRWKIEGRTARLAFHWIAAAGDGGNGGRSGRRKYAARATRRKKAAW